MKKSATVSLEYGEDKEHSEKPNVFEEVKLEAFLEENSWLILPLRLGVIPKANFP